MGSVSERILEEIAKRPGITDKWLAEAIFGPGTPQQRVNGECRRLAAQNRIDRRPREDDGLLGNFPRSGVGSAIRPVTPLPVTAPDLSIFSEDEVKKALETWLISHGWAVEIAWAKTRGVDVAASRSGDRWLIEVKGEGSLNAMRVNYFLSMLGELLQRMDDPVAKHSIALPDLKQFRNLWTRLPALAKQRTGITALFVTRDGTMEEIG